MRFRCLSIAGVVLAVSWPCFSVAWATGRLRNAIEERRRGHSLELNGGRGSKPGAVMNLLLETVEDDDIVAALQ